jgi:hypothetical protein
MTDHPSGARAPTSRFARLARRPFRHRRAALVAWIAVSAAVSTTGGIVLLDLIAVLGRGAPGIDAAEIAWRVGVELLAAVAIVGLAAGGRRRR